MRTRTGLAGVVLGLHVLRGSDRITEFRLEDGSVRLRRGQACVVVRPNRANALDPFNGSAQLRPRLLDRC